MKKSLKSLSPSGQAYEKFMRMSNGTSSYSIKTYQNSAVYIDDNNQDDLLRYGRYKNIIESIESDTMESV